MRRTGLQGSILERVWRARGRIDRRAFLDHYAGKGPRPSRKDQVDAITRALERLIGRGFLLGYGVRTSEKWFIKEVAITPKGRAACRRLLGVQQRLPIN